MHSFKKILCAVDFSQHSPLVAEYSKTMAKTFGAEVLVLHASPVFNLGGHHEVNPRNLQAIEEDIRKSAEKNMEQFVAEHFRGMQATGSVIRSDPAEGILDQAREANADLIVMGTLGRKGISRLLFGSVAEKVVKLSPIPVLTIRTPGE